jgi:hypothetical protein
MTRRESTGAFMVFGKAIRARRAALAALVLAPGAALVFLTGAAWADEGGASFWVPGSFGSMAAVPGSAGWSVATWFYTASTSANATGAFVNGGSYGTIPANVFAGPYAKQYNDTPSGYIVPNYAFKDPILGGQLSLAVTAQVTQSVSTLGGKWTGFASTPNGAQPFAAYGSSGDSISGLGDLAPDATMKWAFGVHYFTAYVTANVPIGQFSGSRLANIGIGHWAVDAGGGYTYFDPKTGYEFSGVLGFTYNFINPTTQYQDGVDMHFDWAASYTFNDKISAGVVGYVFRQISCDTGSGAVDGCDESQVFGVGPQVTYNFPVNDWQGSLNLRAYKEFWAQNRPDGYNVWLTLAVSPPAPPS